MTNFECRRKDEPRNKRARRNLVQSEHGLEACAASGVVLRCFGFSGLQTRWAHRQNAYVPSFLGKLGCLFAAATNAIPMAIKKNEKNWPRVNGPINVASGSRKFSITILKTA